MSRFWKIVLLVIAVLLVAGIGYRMMGGGKQAGGAAPTAGGPGGRGGGDKARDPVPVTAYHTASPRPASISPAAVTSAPNNSRSR